MIRHISEIKFLLLLMAKAPLEHAAFSSTAFGGSELGVGSDAGGKDVMIQVDDEAIFDYVVGYAKRGEVDALKVYTVLRQEREFENPRDSLSSSTKQSSSALLPRRMMPHLPVVSLGDSDDPWPVHVRDGGPLPLSVSIVPCSIDSNGSRCKNMGEDMQAVVVIESFNVADRNLNDEGVIPNKDNGEATVPSL